jgi:hypothetical protein
VSSLLPADSKGKGGKNNSNNKKGDGNVKGRLSLKVRIIQRYFISSRLV